VLALDPFDIEIKGVVTGFFAVWTRDLRHPADMGAACCTPTTEAPDIKFGGVDALETGA
jgi:hypothetical protein